MTDQNTPARQRGRHRKPRPRKLLLAAGGLAVAAGVLSLVRLTPDSDVSHLETAETEPRPDPGEARKTNTAATTAATPTAIPTAASAMGAPTTPPGPTKTPYVHTPTKTTTPAPAGAPTTVPETPDPPPTTSTAPQPTPAQPSNSPAPTPSQPGICVPVIGLCVDPLATND
ncbi:hypothetical protein AB0I98_11760 [Streptomyces sp. NPDC050211]|uniref:hypothetical protein n=1 Tax=Streptomyces sp. NPDC050211 TaxID=3154932 RepID=UPI003419ABA1